MRKPVFALGAAVIAATATGPIAAQDKTGWPESLTGQLTSRSFDFVRHQFGAPGRVAHAILALLFSRMLVRSRPPLSDQFD